MPVKFCDRIEINPAVCHGKPVVRGTRIMVSQVLGALSGGDSIEDVLMDYPSFYHTIPLLYHVHAGIVVVALRQPNRAAIHSRLKWFMENVEQPLNNRVFILRDFSYRVR